MPTSTLDCSCVHYAGPTRLGTRCNVSTPADALIFLDGAAAENPVIPWKLDWHSVISRLRVLALHPERLHQRGHNACGPAVFFRIWFARDPLGAATFGYRLAKSGTAFFGPITVTPSAALLAQDYSAVRASVDNPPTRSMPDDADWMLMSALRDSENMLLDYVGHPHTAQDALAGITLPSTLASWFQATNLYTTVTNSTTVLADTWESLQSRGPGPTRDVALMVNSGFMGDLWPAPNGAPAAADFWTVPNHYVQLLNPVAEGGAAGWINLSFWTWGRTDANKWTSKAKFLSSYFGAVTGYE
jgi:hypothetical protein